MTCDVCDGYGFTTRPAGPLNVQLNDLIKPHPRTGVPMMTVTAAQKYIANLPKEIKGYTDVNRNIQCPKCGGSGT